MVFRSDYTKVTLSSGILSGAIKSSTPWPGKSRIVLGSAGYMFSDTGSGMTMSTAGALELYPLTPIDWDLQIDVVWWTERSTDGMVIASEGIFAPNVSANTSNMTLTSEGSALESTLVTDCTSEMIMYSLCNIANTPEYANWISWSEIGSLDFTISQKNVAGEMPLDWPGRISNIMKLGSKFVVAGLNGVSFLTPSGNFMGLNTVHKIGLLGRDAYAGNDFAHFFIDKLGCLYQLGETLEKLDYREYLSTLTNPVMTLDNSTNIVYMCDGTNGYAYSIESQSMGKCAPNITGIGYQSGTLYVVAPAAVTTPPASIITDIYDFGTRRRKTIHMLEISTDITAAVTVAVDYRVNKASSFSTTSWHTVSTSGKARIVCKGVEFRFRAKIETYENFGLDNFKIIAIAQVR